MVTFPAVIESGSEAKLCVSFLKPNETLQMDIYLIHKNKSRTLLQETVDKELHHCSEFKVRNPRYSKWEINSGTFLFLEFTPSVYIPFIFTHMISFDFMFSVYVHKKKIC